MITESKLPENFILTETHLILPAQKELFEKIKALRKLVWQNSTSSKSTKEDENLWHDAFDPNGYFTLIHLKNELVASARMTLHSELQNFPGGPFYQPHVAELPPPIASFNRMVVHPEYRGLGLSNAIYRRLLTTAKESGANSIGLDCATKHVAYHEKHGFKKLGKPDPSRMFPDLEYQVMGLRF